MKILLLSHKFNPDVGGIEVNSELFADSFHKFGHEVIVVTWTQGQANHQFNYEVVRHPSVIQLIKLNLWADIIFEHNLSLRLSWPCLFTRRPYVTTIATWITRNNGEKALQDILKKWWLRGASNVIAISNAVKNKECPSSVVIPNFYRHELFKNYEEFDQRPFDYVFLGRLVSDKGADLALRAVAEIVNSAKIISSGRSTRLTIIGDGSELLNLKKLANDLNIADCVDFKGRLVGNDLVNCLNQHKFSLIPSSWEEPFGNVALEVMACGCIPVVSDGGGLPEAVGNAGVVFKRNDLQDFIEKLSGLSNNIVQQHVYVLRQQSHLKSYLPETISKAYLEVFEKSLHKK